jgi:HTH-type transcriptional regulator/antitoxin HigA
MNTELTPKEYEMFAMMLDDFIDVVDENENHTLASLMNLVGELIETYENEHVPGLAKIS